ncbi:MAG: nicotinate-nucleotide--dimethylbenzimidazole phosphoribosyltransferase [Geminicoccaceae bacterium]|nr:nicotinate-nucleotide--dimethylbenzimidazole phosphoribosyltransferase [Geminicoccaceae bacterium]
MSQPVRATAHADAYAAARARQNQLTKPPGALGRLEDLACWLAGWQGREKPSLDRIVALVFAGNHGVCERGVAPFPQAVTAQMVANFEAGGAAINQLCRTYGADLQVIPLELDRPTGDISRGPAMTADECARAMQAGADAVPGSADLLLLGEMGIGNTTIGAALAAALLGGAGRDWVGPGTGLDDAGVRRKASVVDEALALHRDHLGDPQEVLRRLGGREQAAMTGAILEARRRSIPVMLDGFICCASALVALRMDERGLDHCQVAHRSGEPGHARMVEAMGFAPILDLGMRLGEGSGAAMALGVLRGAVACHNGMATFADAGVAGQG